MKLIKFLSFIAAIALAGCSSDNDEPEFPYLPDDVPAQSVAYLAPIKAALPGCYSFDQLRNPVVELFAPQQANVMTIERTDGGSFADVKFSITGAFDENAPGLDADGRYEVAGRFEISLVNDHTLKVEMDEISESYTATNSIYFLIPDIYPDKAYANGKIYLLPKDYWKSQTDADRYKDMIIGIGQFPIEEIPEQCIGKFGCALLPGL